MIEIERKFLVSSNAWKLGFVESETLIRQAYLFDDALKSVRIRIKSDRALLTIKMGKGVARDEFEYDIPMEDAMKMIEGAKLPCLEKTRYVVLNDGDRWEVDVFQGRWSGLILAELELTHEEQSFSIPSWLGEEVTSNPQYLNANLFKQL
jgi:adenylate cyclase